MYQPSAGGTSARTLLKATILLALLGMMLLGVFAPRADADEGDVQGSSVLATWNCTGTPCPWGSQTAGQAAVWPAAAEPSRVRHGYTVSHDVYASAAKVVGWKITVTAGDASVYAGTPSGSHSSLASLSAGQSFTVPTLGAGEVVSVQSGGDFQYTLTPGTQPTQEPTSTPNRHRVHADTRPTATPTGQPAGSSVLATWNCSGTPCPWGESDGWSGCGVAGCG